MSSPYGVVVYWPGRADASELVLRHVVALRATFAAGLATSRARLAIAPGAEYVLAIAVNGIAVATLTFAAGSTLGAFAAAADFSVQPGDLLTITAPAVPDASAAGLAITLMGVRGDDRSLVAALAAVATLRATLDRIYLRAELTAEATLTAQLRPENALASTLLHGRATLWASLTSVETLHAKLGPGGGVRCFGRLTVTHDPELFR